MPPASNEEQFKFLISCIRYSNNGKVDFGQVALECKIVSRGAAAKRYERMMRAHGIAPNAATIKSAPSRPTKPDGKNNSIETSTKKRKTDLYVEENTATDDEEVFSTPVKFEPTPVKEEKYIPTEQKYIPPEQKYIPQEQKYVPFEEKNMVKQEEHSQGQQLSMHDAAHLMSFYDAPSNYIDLGEQIYSENEYGSMNGYVAPMAPMAPMDYRIQPPYEFGSGYRSSGMGGIPQTIGDGYGYDSMTQYSLNQQGRSDSPVILE